MKKELVDFKINGRTHALAIEPSALLLDGLRQNLGLTGSKRGCDESSWGVCTVLVETVGDLTARTAKPLTTSTLTPEYRREMIRIFTQRAVLAAASN